MAKKKLIDADELTMALNDFAIEKTFEWHDDREIKYTEKDVYQMIYRTVVDVMGWIDRKEAEEAIPVDWLKERQKLSMKSLDGTYTMIERLISDWEKGG